MAKKRSLLRRIGRALLILFVLLLAGAGVLAYFAFRVTTVALDDHAWVLLGGGGNTLVLDGPEGPLVVDTKFGPPAATLEREVKRIAGKPVKMVIDTHYHIDHTHGNPRFPGAEFVSAKRTRDHLLELDAKTFGPGSDGEHEVPTTLIDDGMVKQINFGDDFVEVRQPGRGHTDGDVVVFLHKRSVLHTGDLFVNGYYPIIDPKGGGSFAELGPTLDKVIAIGAAKIIPGHGPIATPDDLVRYRKYVAALWDHVRAGVKAGKSKQEIEKGFDATPYRLSNLMVALTSLSKNVAQAYDEAVALEGKGAKP
jgi:glyoxylase-like metal-dependent hydrolase (beta-lactamase superfamily II)